MHRYSKLSVVTVALATTGAVALAASSVARNDALAAAQAKISLTQAIAAAEQHAGGKASKAEFEHSKQGSHYEVEVVGATQVFDVKVDADSGTVLSSQEDKAD
ncbi:MAG: PepSY domain-containing protein [Proteobacteria bacterium]|nr:PepSY domain-containing protein [Pseudomonadota bacterium]